MSTFPDKWKISCEQEAEEIPQNFKEIEKIIKEKRKEFTEENRKWVKANVISEEEFINEKEARNYLLDSILSYAKVCRKFVNEGNNYLLLCETWKKIRDELNAIVNQNL